VKRHSSRPRHFQFETADRVTLAGTVCSHEAPRMVLLAPGFWRGRKDPENLFVTEHLFRLGYDVAALDFRGHGESGGSYTFGREEWKDFLALARCFPASGREFAAVGFSMGGSIAADAIARDPSLPFRALVMVSSPADFSRLRPRPWKPNAWKMLGLRRALSPPHVDWSSVPREKPKAEEAVEALTIPKLVVTFEDDWLVRPLHGDRLERAAAPPIERAHLPLPGSLHADAVVRFAPVKFFRILDSFLKRWFPPLEAVSQSSA